MEGGCQAELCEGVECAENCCCCGHAIDSTGETVILNGRFHESSESNGYNQCEESNTVINPVHLDFSFHSRWFVFIIQ